MKKDENKERLDHLHQELKMLELRKKMMEEEHVCLSHKIMVVSDEIAHRHKSIEFQKRPKPKGGRK